MIKYKKETIDKIKEIYPLRQDLVKLAEEGHASLYRILDELANDMITAFDIVKAFESIKKEDIRNLYDRARTNLAKAELYDMAMEDMYHSYEPETEVEEPDPPT
jgi:L-2-hydroxyglutarate oxidase LhgO